MARVSAIDKWYVVYRKIAIALDSFYQKNRRNSGSRLLERLRSSKAYQQHNQWLSNVKRMETPSIDPIQLFVSFSRSGQSNVTRTEIIQIVWELLDIPQRMPERIDFEGCPKPMAIKLQYFRKEDVQEQIWIAFHELVGKKQEALSDALWDQVKTWRGIQVPSFTIFMFWIDSESFIPLDRNTRQYLQFLSLLPRKLILSFETYIKLLNEAEVRDYSELSIQAYYFANNREKYEERFGAETTKRNLNRAFSHFKLIGIRTLDRNKAHHKVLKPNTYYPFDQQLLPVDLSDQTVRPPTEFFINKQATFDDLHQTENLWVNITAIVGKNGAGKSTLIDLILMGIYNLAILQKFLRKKSNEAINDLNFEIYWLSDTLYKLVFDTAIRLHRFGARTDSDVHYRLETNDLPIDDVPSEFFYSILINYSHYALNSNDYKVDWIYALSHKNDGYLTPVVISPQRTRGNIDINRERQLLNIRLLLNVLELHDKDIPERSFRVLDNNKMISSFSATLNDIKVDAIKKEISGQKINGRNNRKLIIDTIVV